MHRPSDAELVGYLTLDERGATPVTLVGYPLAGPLEHADAEELLRARGLAVLAEPWWLDTESGGFRVQIMSAWADSVTVARADHGLVSPDAEHRELPVPAAGLRPYVR
ncbi:hypothetical protein [uncultured Friedmanniella sp.]|uniref:hypothetical protein n=1 Tax=uncultured Friedmanniella sp. TaxID=335381 RepID=UPI0035CB3A0A